MGTELIDLDLHAHIPGTEAVLPYMDRSWRKVFENQEFQLSARATDRYFHPGGGALREDTRTADGAMPASNPAFVAADLLDRYGISAAVLLPLQAASIAGWTDPVRADAFTRAMNDLFIAEWHGADSRFKPTITVSPLDPEQSAKEVHRLAATPGVVGVQLPLIDTLMGNRYYYPIYEAAQEHGLPIVLHPWGAEACTIGAPTVAGGQPRTYAERHALLGQIGQSNLVSLVFEGVFERFPGLKVVFVEYGFSWLATMLWRMDKEWTSFRMEVPWLKRAPSEYVLDHVRFSTQPIDEPPRPEEMDAIMGMLSAERTVMFASDYPHWDTDNPDLVVKRLPERFRDAVAFGVARETFGSLLDR